MSSTIFVTLCIISAIISDAICWTNYRVIFRALNLDYYNPEYGMPHQFKVKKLNRTYSTIIINGTFTKPLDNIWGEAQLYQRMSNRYKEQFTPLKLELCPLLESLKVTTGSSFVANVVSKLLLPTITKFRENGQKFPDRCPVPADNYHINYHLDENLLPSFLLPEGTWKIVANVTMSKIMLGKAHIVFDVVNYSSEKQKNKLG